MSDPTARPADTCPRCGGRFHCGTADPGPCACASLVLGADLLERLRQQYTRCLCLGCLQALARGVGGMRQREPG